MSASPIPFPVPELAQSLTTLPGVGPATAKALAARGFSTLGDALFLLPRGYEDRRRIKSLSELEQGAFAVAGGRIASAGRWGKKGKLFRMVLADDRAELSCLWFHFNPRLMNGFEKGDEVVVAGEVGVEPKGGLSMIHPEVYPADQAGPDKGGVGRVVPVYPGVEGVRAGSLRRIMSGLVDRVSNKMPDPLSGLLPESLYPFDVNRAILMAHRPEGELEDSDLTPRYSAWRRVLAVNELFYYELGLALKKLKRQSTKAEPIDPAGGILKRFLDGLPFALTPGQEQAIFALKADMARPWPMGRLLAGDVGTGKTVVAAAAAALTVEAGMQAALMAPTEVLANQHLDSLKNHLEPLGVEVVLITGSMKPAQRAAALEAAKKGAGLIIGTHALLSRGMSFSRLGLVIIDEQHRFGVEQRLTLAEKGLEPHVLVLSATPIPRTLSLALSGHLDISDLPERPGKRPPVETRVLSHKDRRQAVEALAKCLAQRQRAYVICPLVEASQAVKANDAVETHRNLSRYFPEYKVGLLHGRMEAAEQARVLDGFKKGDISLLVATTVVEVGVDVSQATLMVVLGAERFGLSQLHQLRGRVGRGDEPGRCIMVAGPEPGDLAIKRLTALAGTDDGMAVAEADLTLRGPGEALGSRQSGLPAFKVADWMKDAPLAPLMRELIQAWLEADPELSSPELAQVAKECLRRWGRAMGLMD